MAISILSSRWPVLQFHECCIIGSFMMRFWYLPIINYQNRSITLAGHHLEGAGAAPSLISYLLSYVPKECFALGGQIWFSFWMHLVASDFCVVIMGFFANRLKIHSDATIAATFLIKFGGAKVQEISNPRR